MKADKRVLQMGGRNVSHNNVNPQFRGSVTINGVTCEVTTSQVIEGLLHFRVFGRDESGPFAAWTPAFLVEIP